MVGGYGKKKAFVNSEVIGGGSKTRQLSSIFEKGETGVGWVWGKTFVNNDVMGRSTKARHLSSIFENGGMGKCVRQVW